jgi:hypothetical protein
VTAEIGKVLLIILFVIIAFGGGLYIRTFLTKRGIFRVVEIFYEHDAVGIYSAKTLQELGLERPDILQRMTRPRDYRQTALQVLIREGVVNVTEDGRVYVIEEKLDPSLRRKRKEV